MFLLRPEAQFLIASSLIHPVYLDSWGCNPRVSQLFVVLPQKEKTGKMLFRSP